MNEGDRSHPRCNPCLLATASHLDARNIPFKSIMPILPQVAVAFTRHSMHKCERMSAWTGCTPIRLHSLADRNLKKRGKKGKFAGIEPYRRAIAKRGTHGWRQSRAKTIGREDCCRWAFMWTEATWKESVQLTRRRPNVEARPAILGEASNCRGG